MGTAGCVVLVVSLFDTMARLQHTDTRQEISDLLAEPPFRGSGVSVDQVLGVLRGLGYTAGALAAAGAVLAVFVAQRHRGARIGFTIVAALLLLTMPTTGLLPVLPAFAAGLLWRRDVRDWFAGRAPVPAAAAAPLAPTPPSAPSSTQRSTTPPSPPATPFATPTPSPRPFADPAPVSPAPPVDRRPGTVTAAAVLAMAGSLLGLLAGLAVMLVLAVSPSTVEDAITSDSQFQRVDLAAQQVVAVLWGTSAVMVLWSLAAIVLTVLTLRRNSVARILLAVSAGMAALFSLLAILSGVAAVTLLLGATTVGLLLSPGANDWFAGRRVSRSDPPW
jgi:GNAT superfamily N-acetyltransferase